MREIVDWLRDIEDMAGSFYRNAAVLFEEDKELAAFLRRLAKEEAWHSRVMGEAEKYLSSVSGQSSSISVDPSTKERITGPIRKCQEMVSGGSITKECLIECLVKTESSERNDIFVYVVNTFKNTSREFAHVAAKIQQHVKGIERFLESLPGAEKYLETIRELPSVWDARILIVDDYEPIVALLSAILEREGIVESVENGEEALRKTREQYFDIIVSDVDMPIMDGIKFYNQAAKTDPRIGERFLFFVGRVDKYGPFFAQNNLRYLVKPASVNDIKHAVIEILERIPEHP